MRSIWTVPNRMPGRAGFPSGPTASRSIRAASAAPAPERRSPVVTTRDDEHGGKAAMDKDVMHHRIVTGDDLSDEAMDRLRERLDQQPEIDRESDAIAARAGLPGEGDRRDRAVPDVGGLADDYAEQDAERR